MPKRASQGVRSNYPAMDRAGAQGCHSPVSTHTTGSLLPCDIPLVRSEGLRKGRGASATSSWAAEAAHSFLSSLAHFFSGFQWAKWGFFHYVSCKVTVQVNGVLLGKGLLTCSLTSPLPSFTYSFMFALKQLVKSLYQHYLQVLSISRLLLCSQAVLVS